MQNTTRLWHHYRVLPTPGAPLRLRLSNGEEVDGVRPSYVESRDQNDLGYEAVDGQKLIEVVEWSIR
jgi:hypothetical protein